MSLTTTQLAKASRMWADGIAGKAIAHELGVTLREFWAATCNHRGMFPRRYRQKGSGR